MKGPTGGGSRRRASGGDGPDGDPAPKPPRAPRVASPARRGGDGPAGTGDRAAGEGGTAVGAAPPGGRGRPSVPPSPDGRAAAPGPGPQSPQTRRPELGPRHLGSLIPRVARPAFKRRSPAAAGLMADWPALVGPAVAAIAQPLRFSGDTLTLGCLGGPAAMDLQHRAPQLIARINAGLGAVVVRSLRFVQRPAPPPAAPPRPPPRPLPGHVEGRLLSVDDPALRDALERLARGVYRGR